MGLLVFVSHMPCVTFSVFMFTGTTLYDTKLPLYPDPDLNVTSQIFSVATAKLMEYKYLHNWSHTLSIFA